jgi:hypothetical protein
MKVFVGVKTWLLGSTVVIGAAVWGGIAAHAAIVKPASPHVCAPKSIVVPDCCSSEKKMDIQCEEGQLLDVRRVDHNSTVLMCLCPNDKRPDPVPPEKGSLRYDAQHHMWWMPESE